jgi:hypothetical protein
MKPSEEDFSDWRASDVTKDVLASLNERLDSHRKRLPSIWRDEGLYRVLCGSIAELEEIINEFFCKNKEEE